MAIVSVAILISFHLKHQASHLEKRIALPLGIVFWLLVRSIPHVKSAGIMPSSAIQSGGNLHENVADV